jgi:DNA-binding transcriptional regulator/RsmH inhibitor MraZ
VVLPEKSLQRAGLDEVEKVTLVGKGDHIEIWPTDEWEQVIEETMPHYGEMLYEAAELLDGDSRGDA